MISLRGVALRRGSKLLFQGANATFGPGDRVGVVGRNGSGKSSLLAALSRDLAVDEGDIELPTGLTLASLGQEPPATDRPAIEYVKDGDEELRCIEHTLAAADASIPGERLASLHARLEAIEGYSADTRAAKLLVGLGFEPEQLQQPVDRFSGGWRMRLALAQALMCRSDLLLLDEPTNHLDFEAIVWLESWVQRYPGILLVISHDRDFLDNVINRVAHIEGQSVLLYRGNYTDFERLRAERLKLQQTTYEKRSREAVRIRRFVDRFRAKASKARQAQSRLKALERMEIVSAAHLDSPFSFEFPAPSRCPSPLLTLDHVTVGYDATTVLDAVNLSLTPGMRLGLLGRNGAGKTTLLRTLAGDLAPVSGQRIAHPGLVIGYFAQHQLERLDPRASALLHHQRRDPGSTEQRLRGFLGGFGFGGEMADAPVELLSGGEKARLVLSVLVSEAPNLLLLDEPTNHLDLEMRRALELALQDFDGGLVVVSHDRHLLRMTTDELKQLDRGRLLPFDGDVGTYGLTRPAEPALGSDAAPADKGPGASLSPADRDPRARDQRRDRRRNEADTRRRLKPVTTRIERIEKLMGDLAERQASIDSALADPALYGPDRKAELGERLFDRARTAQELEQLEQEWLALQEGLEAG